LADLQPLGRLLLVAGVLMAVVGAVLAFGIRIPFLGQLPGDIRLDRDGATVFIPLGTMLLLSVILTLVLNLLARR
jgi:Protein of unknown function (DUF2905)